MVLRRAGLDPVSVENSVHPGTPDINYISGWLELKYVPFKPKKWETIVKIRHFTPQQRIWLRQRWHMGGNAYLLLQVEKDYYLFNGCVASRLLGEVNCEILGACKYGADKWWWLGSLADLPAILTHPRTEERCCGRRIVAPRE